MNTDTKDSVKLHVIPFQSSRIVFKELHSKSCITQPTKKKKKKRTKGTHETIMPFHSLLMLDFFYAITYSDP